MYQNIIIHTAALMASTKESAKGRVVGWRCQRRILGDREVMGV